MNERDCGNGSGTLFGTPLVFAGQLWHRVITNKERPMRVAKDLGLTKPQVVGVCKMLKAAGYVPSAERLAVAAMIVPDVTDEDIAEWFGRDVAWAADVRANADYWRKAEPFPLHLEYIDDGYQPGDPTPGEVAAMARKIRRITPRKPEHTEFRVGLQNFSWNGSQHAFIPISVE
jgi:hypothetical protein